MVSFSQETTLVICAIVYWILLIRKFTSKQNNFTFSEKDFLKIPSNLCAKHRYPTHLNL